MNYKLISKCLDLAEDSVIITEANLLDDPGPKIIYVNQSFIQLTGYEYDDVIGKNPRFLQGKETSRDELDKIAIALREQKYVQVELINYRKDGTPFWIELSISPIFDEAGNIEYFISVQKQIDAKKAQAFLLQKTLKELNGKVNTLDQVNIASVHNLKEPIRTIYSFSQLLERNIGDTLDEKSKEYLIYIKSGIKQLESTINAIHQYSSNDSFGKKEIDLVSVINEVRLNLANRIIDENIKLVVNGHATIKGNRNDLFSVFQNLIDNAIKHRKPNQFPIIEIEMSELESKVRVLIKDNGIGISLDFQAKIFNLFFKGNVVDDESLGAGLAICQKNINAHNGTIRLVESSDQGTTFEIIFFRMDLQIVKKDFLSLSTNSLLMSKNNML